MRVGHASGYRRVNAPWLCALVLLASLPPASATVEPAESIAISLAHTTTPSDVPLSLRATLTGPSADATTLKAFVLSEDQASKLRSADLDVVGAALDVALLERGQQTLRVQLSAPGSLRAGTYFLYLQDSKGHDNRHELAQFRAVQLAVLPVRSEWLQGFNPDLSYRVTLGGQAASGEIGFVERDASLHVPDIATSVERGHGLLEATRMDALDPGTYMAVFRQSPQDSWVPTYSTLTVVEPQMVVLPTDMLAGLGTQFTVWLARPPDNGTIVSVSVNGSRIIDVRADDPVTRFVWRSPSVGAFDVQVGRVRRETVAVMPDLHVTFRNQSSDTFQLILSDTQGFPAANVRVAVDGLDLGITNGSGELIIDRLTIGNHDMTFFTDDDVTLHRPINASAKGVVDGMILWPIEVAGLTGASGTIQAAVTLSNPTVSPLNATVLAVVDSAIPAAQRILVPALSTREAYMTISSVSAGAHNLTFQAFSLAQDPVRFEEDATETPGPAGGCVGGSICGLPVGLVPVSERVDAAVRVPRVQETDLERPNDLMDPSNLVVIPFTEPESGDDVTSAPAIAILSAMLLLGMMGRRRGRRGAR